MNAATAGTPVTAAALRRILRDGGGDPATIALVRTQAAWPGGGETHVWFASVAAADAAMPILRAAWTDGARRLRGASVFIGIDRNGAADVPPAPPMPAEFDLREPAAFGEPQPCTPALAAHAWAWLVWSVRHNGGELDGFAPALPGALEMPLMWSPWTTFGEPRADSPGRRTLIVSPAGHALVESAA